MRPSVFSPRLLPILCAVAAASLCAPLNAQSPYGFDSSREHEHQSPQWPAIQAHLPNPMTATEQELETQADVLRARGFPEDAMDYYKYALDRGGNRPELLNKIGVTELSMRNVVLARPYFQRVVKLTKKNADAWNNLGAVEYLDGGWDKAVTDYKKAVKLDRNKAVFHANLSTAYFQQKDYSSGRREMGAAMSLDPQIYERADGLGGVSVHVLSSIDRARFSFEMASLYATNGLVEEMLRALAKASEAGMDVQREMRTQPALAKYVMDPRVVALVHNAEMLRASQAETTGAPRTNGAAAPAIP